MKLENNWVSGLYLAPSPIGNLGDLTFRVVEALKRADLVLAEDTRRSVKILNYLSLKKKLLSYREQNHSKVWPEILKVLTDGGLVVLLTDAGAPTISDPGSFLVAEVLKNFKVFPLPGPSAVITALMASGFLADNFIFAGFLPAKTKARKDYLLELYKLPFTLVFFESPHRLAASLEDLWQILGNRKILMAREMSKIYEEYWRGNLEDLILEVKETPRKGEITLVVEKGEALFENEELTSAEIIKIAQKDSRKTKDLAKFLAKQTKLSSSELYNLILEARARKQI